MNRSTSGTARPFLKSETEEETDERSDNDPDEAAPDA